MLRIESLLFTTQCDSELLTVFRLYGNTVYFLTLIAKLKKLEYFNKLQELFDFIIMKQKASPLDANLEAPEWMHRLLIGQNGAAIKKVSKKFGNGKVKINLCRDNMMGPHEGSTSPA